MMKSFFISMQERDRFFRDLDAGDLTVIPGSWFRHASAWSQCDTLGEFTYNQQAVLHDCARIAAVEIETATGNRHDVDAIKRLPMFRFCFERIDRGSVMSSAPSDLGSVMRIVVRPVSRPYQS